MAAILSRPRCVNTMQPKQYGYHFAGDISKTVFVYGNVIILIQISMKIVPQGPTHNNSNTSSAKGSVLSSNKPLPDPKLTKIYNTI